MIGLRINSKVLKIVKPGAPNATCADRNNADSAPLSSGLYEARERSRSHKLVVCQGESPGGDFRFLIASLESRGQDALRELLCRERITENLIKDMNRQARSDKTPARAIRPSRSRARSRRLRP
jgi:hypothetical protein